MMVSILRLMALLGFPALVLCSCSHALEITNLEDYYVPPSAPLAKPVTLGVTSKTSKHPIHSRYVSAIVDSLRKNSSVKQVVFPYDSARHDKVDFVSDATVEVEYHGSAGNFFVNFPGFLIWAPAIWGYGYGADIKTTVALTRSSDERSRKLSIPTHYYFRHAEIDRTFTEIGWFEIGIIPFIGGFVFTGYDTDATGEFIEKVSDNYGNFVTSKMLRTMATFDQDPSPSKARPSVGDR